MYIDRKNRSCRKYAAFLRGESMSKDKKAKVQVPPKKRSDPGVARHELVAFLDEFLGTTKIADSSCNGLQVEGAAIVKKVGVAVDACIETYTKACEQKCQMLIVHHGLIWSGITTVQGRVRNHLKYMLEHELNLYASHLPLDAHKVVGNNMQLAHIIGLTDIEPAFSYRAEIIGVKGNLPKKQDCRSIAKMLQKGIGGQPQVLDFNKKSIETVGIVSGGGASDLGQAVAMGLDCFITGESSHSAYHIALEAGISVIYGGHYFTETVGVRALGHILQKQFSLDVEFIDVPVQQVYL